MRSGSSACRKSLFVPLRAVFRTFKSSKNLLMERARGPQGSAARGLRATAASGGGKGAKKLGSHLVLRKQRAAQMLSANPDLSPLHTEGELP